jgi:hypothetical protein
MPLHLYPYSCVLLWDDDYKYYCVLDFLLLQSYHLPSMFGLLSKALVMIYQTRRCHIPQDSKVKLSLCLLVKHYDMKTYGEWGLAPPFLTSALVGREWSASRPCHFIPRGNNPQYPLDRRLGGLQSRYGCCGEETNLALPGIEPGPSSL